MKRNINYKYSGMTLLELMIGLVIFGILAAIIMPALTGFVQSNRQVYYTNEFTTFMHLARSEAIKRGVTAGVTATNSADANNEWGPGWTLWADLAGGTPDTYDAGEELRVSAASQGQITVDSVIGNASYTYSPDGSLSTGIGDTINICDDGRTGEPMRQLTTTVTGRLNLDTTQTCP